MKINLGYQVYSAREEAEKDLLGVLRELADIGYDAVELAGTYGHSAAEICAMLRETGLRAVSAHVPFDAIVADMPGTIEFYKSIGCQYIAVPYLDEQTRPGAPGFAMAIRRIHEFGALCKASGIPLLYHNHDFEFVSVSGQYGLDFLYDAIPAELLATELDTCWVKVAGEDPSDYIRKYAGRCPVVNLKDFVGGQAQGEALYALINEDGSDDAPVEAGAEPAFELRPVGHGVQDIPSIIRAGLQSGTEWFVVEQDRSVGRTPLEAARMSAEAVRKIEKQR